MITELERKEFEVLKGLMKNSDIAYFKIIANYDQKNFSDFIEKVPERDMTSVSDLVNFLIRNKLAKFFIQELPAKEGEKIRGTMFVNITDKGKSFKRFLEE